MNFTKTDIKLKIAEKKENPILTRYANQTINPNYYGIVNAHTMPHNPLITSRPSLPTLEEIEHNRIQYNENKIKLFEYLERNATYIRTLMYSNKHRHE